MITNQGSTGSTIKILPNGIAVIEGDTHISKWVEETGRLDHDQWLLGKILPYIKEGDTVVDAGAFIGDHTVAYLRKVGPYGRVIAFEPGSEAFRCLVRNCPDAERFWYGLSDSEDHAPMKSFQEGNFGANGFVCDEGISRPTMVTTITLDKLQLERLNFLKMDIEGFEFKALKGAKETLTRLRPTCLIEINRDALSRNDASFFDIHDFFMGTLGYRDFIPLPNDIDLAGAPQFDVLYLP